MVHFCRYCDAIESKRWHRIVLSRQQLQARVCHGCLLLPQRGPRAHKKVCAIASQVLAFRAEPRATANERKATSTFGTKQTSALLSATSAFGVERTLQPKLPTRDQALRVAAIYFRKRTSSQKGRRNCAQRRGATRWRSASSTNQSTKKHRFQPRAFVFSARLRSDDSQNSKAPAFNREAVPAQPRSQKRQMTARALREQWQSLVMLPAT